MGNEFLMATTEFVSCDEGNYCLDGVNAFADANELAVVASQLDMTIPSVRIQNTEGHEANTVRIGSVGGTTLLVLGAGTLTLEGSASASLEAVTVNVGINADTVNIGSASTNLNVGAFPNSCGISSIRGNFFPLSWTLKDDEEKCTYM